jgi:hypothetical protein
MAQLSLYAPSKRPRVCSNCGFQSVWSYSGELLCQFCQQKWKNLGGLWQIVEKGQEFVEPAEPKVLTVRWPECWLIMTGEKDIENRRWKTEPRILWIHAGLKHNDKKYGLDEEYRQYAGKILGYTHVVGCVRNSESRWAIPGKWQWELACPEWLPEPWPKEGKLKGQLSWMDLPKEVESEFCT